MEKFDIFKDIAERTGGDIYIGVVGPVRTGKSTFIRKFMEMLVLPNIIDPDERQRTVDELPQGGMGRTIMTTEPKFIPDEGVRITIKDRLSLRVRIVDCVGYTVPGATGYEDEHGPRLVNTPWFEEGIPFQEAAEIGTRKVIAEHSTIGVVVTTDGSFTDIPREDYVDAEERVVGELKEIGKPFVVILNSCHPDTKDTLGLAERLEAEYDVPVIPMDVTAMGEDDIYDIMEQVLYEFPVREVVVNLPRWVEELEPGHRLRTEFEESVAETIRSIRRLRDVEKAVEALAGYDFIEKATLESMEMGTGVATVDLQATEALFWKTVEEMTGFAIGGKHDLLRQIKDLVHAKQEFDVIREALEDVRTVGYGMVPPQVSEMTFEDPELIRQGGRYGVRLRASAPSLHFIRADVETEVTPIIGTERQCEELVKYLLEKFEDDPKKIWESDIFGKSLQDLVREGIENKLFRMPENAQAKIQETLTRIINEGSGGLICILI
ncbi:MAG TPA: stage IV sporulation protein A [Clostridiales bacterium]|nr:stage IV sporulation protein A [Clostridiales bacterium]